MAPRVAIVHPWLPQYRVPFFEMLVPEMKKRGIEVEVYYGTTPPEWRRRGDTGESDICTELPTRFVRIGGRSIGMKSIKKITRAEPFDLIILEQAIRNLETAVLLFHPRTRRKLAFWGHGKNYTVARSRVEESLKSRLTTAGKWFFGYTEGGVRASVQSGFPADRTTVVYNSTDTTTLRQQISLVKPKQLQDKRAELLLAGPTALYIGGLDEAKRIPFLLAAADKVAKQIPDFTLIIAGSGEMRYHVENAANNCDYIRYVGTVFGDEKAILLSLSDILMIPGRVGLVAVESAASGVPIVTTNWDFHAPEFEYLTHNHNCIAAENDTSSYAQSTIELLQEPIKLARLQNACRELGTELNMERMVSQFSTGVEQALAAR